MRAGKVLRMACTFHEIERVRWGAGPCEGACEEQGAHIYVGTKRARLVEKHIATGQ